MINDTLSDHGSGGAPEVPTHLEPSKEERKWAVLDHLSAFIGFLGVPVGAVLGPLLVWFLKKDDLPFVNEQGREAVNFNLSLILYSVILGLIGITLFAMESSLTWVVGGLFFILSVYWIYQVISAAVHAYKGIHFHYPLTVHFF